VSVGQSGTGFASILSAYSYSLGKEARNRLSRVRKLKNNCFVKAMALIKRAIKNDCVTLALIIRSNWADFIFEEWCFFTVNILIKQHRLSA